LVGRPECRRPLERPGRRWEDNIKMELREIGIDGAKVAGFCEHGNEPSVFIRKQDIC